MVGKIRNMEENGRENEEYAKFTIFLRYFMVCNDLIMNMINIRLSVSIFLANGFICPTTVDFLFSEIQGTKEK